jgi:hypothetical protein
MRLWSIHPVYLDSRGLTALWREGLLARKVLQGRTKGYRNHPQLERFRSFKDPVAGIDCYLLHVFEEAQRRGYSFDRDKLGVKPEAVKIPVTKGQIKYETQHLKRKLKLRNTEQYRKLASVKNPQPHPIFDVVEGNVEPWESVVGH